MGLRSYRYFADQYEGNVEPDLDLYAHYGHTLYAHKASEGCYHIDRAHARRVRKAHSLGLSVLHYHFARPDEGGPAAREAGIFWSVVKPLWRPGDRLALDLEARPGARWEAARGYPELLWNAVHRTSGQNPLIYGSTSFLTGEVPRALLRKHARWEAAYGPMPGRGPWRRHWWAWQQTDGIVGPKPHACAGIGDCDVSLLYLPVAVAIRARVRARQVGRKW